MFKKIVIFTIQILIFFYGSAWSDSMQEDEDALQLNPSSFSEGQAGKVHGFFDLSFKNAYITPRGLLITNTGLTIQVLTGLLLDVYSDREGIINKITLFGAVWNDIWTEQHHPNVGCWNAFDWFAGADILFAKHWKFGVQFLQYLSPPGYFRSIQNIEFVLAYDDSWLKNPVSFNPYLKIFWNLSGDSVVVVGRRGKTYDVEFGLYPTFNFKSLFNIPLVLAAPTWITVGPKSFWNRGGEGSKGKNSHFGLFSTGLEGTYDLSRIIPKEFGNWYLKGGVQYYYLINQNLLRAQTFTLGISLHHTHRNVVVGYLGTGFNF